MDILPNFIRESGEFFIYGLVHLSVTAPVQRQLATQTVRPADNGNTERIGELEKEVVALKQENNMYERQADFYYDKLVSGKTMWTK